MASEPFSGFGGVLGRPGAVPGVLASSRLGGGLSHRFNQSACMHGGGNDGGGGDQPEQSRQTAEEEDGAGEE